MTDDELDGLSDGQLLERISEARSAGAFDDAKRALAILVWRHHANVERRVRLRVRTADVEDVAMEAVVSAIRSILAGTSIGEFRAWLNRIVRRRIADYHRRPEIDTTVLPEEHAESDEVWGQAGVVDDPTAAVDLQSIIDQALDILSPPHRAVVELYVFEDRPAADAAAAANAKFSELNPPMSENNVQQIASRFRAELRRLLEDSDNPG